MRFSYGVPSQDSPLRRVRLTAAWSKLKVKFSVKKDYRYVLPSVTLKAFLCLQIGSKTIRLLFSRGTRECLLFSLVYQLLGESVLRQRSQVVAKNACQRRFYKLSKSAKIFSIGMGFRVLPLVR